MLIEVKVKVARIIDSKIRKRTETFLIDNCQVMSEAEYKVMSELAEEQSSNLIDAFEVQSLRISPIKEVCTQYEGDCSFVATLKDLFTDDNGNEKPIKYKVLLWANSLSEANSYVQELAQQGYDMHIEGIKEVNYSYEQTPSANEVNVTESV